MWVILEITSWVCVKIISVSFAFLVLHLNFSFLMILVVDEKSVGQSKAKCVCEFLQELNDAVKTKFIEEYPEALIETNPSFFSQFTLVVATQVRAYAITIPLLLCLLRSCFSKSNRF